jgi:hypothetical protein
LLSLNLRKIGYYTLIIGKCCQNVNTVLMSHKLTVEERLAMEGVLPTLRALLGPKVLTKEGTIR